MVYLILLIHGVGVLMPWNMFINANEVGIQFCHSKLSPLRGHPFMTSTRRGAQTQVDACGRGGGQAPCGRPHRKLKLESTDVILSSSLAKKLASFLPEFSLWM